MKNKKITLICILICILLLFTGCASTFEERITGYDTKSVQTNSVEYKKVVAENGDFSSVEYTVDNGGMKIFSDKFAKIISDNGVSVIQSITQTASGSANPPTAYVDSVVAVVDAGVLPAGFYEVTFSMSASGTGNTPIYDIRAFHTDVIERNIIYDIPEYDGGYKEVPVDANYYETLGYVQIAGNDLVKQSGYNDYKMSFIVYEEKSVTLWVTTYGYTTPPVLKVKSANLRAISAEEQMQVQDISKYISGDGIEDDVVYDDDTLYTFDVNTYLANIRDARYSYDILAILSTIQGLVNRDGQHLWLFMTGLGEGASIYSDPFWLNYLTQEGQFMEGKRIEAVTHFGTILKLFKDKINGLVVWDESVSATSNVAFTISGVENLIPVRFDAKVNSLMNILVNEYGFEVKHNLVGRFKNEKGGLIWNTDLPTTGSAKNDAYLWAKVNYLDKGLCNNTIMGNLVDSFTYDRQQVSTVYYTTSLAMITNRDFLVKNKAFMWDLLCFEDAIPNDDPYQDLGTDYRTAVQILYSQNQQHDGGEASRIVGFPPWWQKYTNWQNIDVIPLVAQYYQVKDVELEWATTALYGYFNIVKDADAYGTTGLCNASILSQTPLIEYEQPGKYNKDNINPEYASIKTKEEIPVSNYLLMYVGDYDCGAWGNKFIPTFFSDPNLNQYPLCWPVVTNLLQRIPNVYNYMYETAPDNIYFVGGDNGYGYQNAEYMMYREDLCMEGVNGIKALTEEQVANLKGSIDSYVDQTLEWYALTKIDVQLFYISHFAMQGEWAEKITRMAPEGFAFFNGSSSTEYDRIVNGIPVIAQGSLTYSGTKFVYEGKDASSVTQPTFSVMRTVLKTPTELATMLRNGESQNVTVLDPYTFFYLYSIYYGS